MKTEILKLLRESGNYISGQELCSKFGVSRTAVWKVINQLKEEAVFRMNGRAGIFIIMKKLAPRILMQNASEKRAPYTER